MITIFICLAWLLCAFNVQRTRCIEYRKSAKNIATRTHIINSLQFLWYFSFFYDFLLWFTNNFITRSLMKSESEKSQWKSCHSKVWKLPKIASFNMRIIFIDTLLWIDLYSFKKKDLFFCTILRIHASTSGDKFPKYILSNSFTENEILFCVKHQHRYFLQFLNFLLKKMKNAWFINMWRFKIKNQFVAKMLVINKIRERK